MGGAEAIFAVWASAGDSNTPKTAATANATSETGFLNLNFASKKLIALLPATSYGF